MNAGRLQQLMSDYSHALEQLEEAVSWSQVDQVHRDSAILRFVLVYEVAWKTLMLYLAESGSAVNSPRDAFRQAYRQRLIDDEALWLSMIRDRNLVAHTYRETTAVAVYEQIGSYAPAYRRNYDLLREKLRDA